MKNISTQLLEEVNSLPVDLAQEVLDFTLFLKQKGFRSFTRTTDTRPLFGRFFALSDKNIDDAVDASKKSWNPQIGGL